MNNGQPDRVPLALAAERLGLSTEAVRKRIQRGTLPGHKIDGAWFVDASALLSGRPDDISSRPDDDDQTSGQGATAGWTGIRTASPAGVVDLTPLVEMIERLQGENQRLTEATTAWQFRARAAEDRLAALEAGEPVTDAPRSPMWPLLATKRTVWVSPCGTGVAAVVAAADRRRLGGRAARRCFAVQLRPCDPG